MSGSISFSISSKNPCATTIHAAHALLLDALCMTIHDTAQRDRFAALISRMPWKKLERRVMQRLLEASLDPADRDGTKLRDWLREMFHREADTEAEERLSIAKMLQRHGLHLLVLEWITFDMGLKETALCTTRLDSLIAVKLWAEAAGMINHPATPLPRPLQAIMQAHLELLATGGKSLKSGVLLRDALTAARKRDNQGAFVAIARLAAQFDHHDIAVIAYSEAMDPRFPVALFLADAFIQEVRHTGGSAEVVLHQLTRRAHEEAWNQDLLRQVRYYRVLCGEGIEVVEAEASQCSRNNRKTFTAPSSSLLPAFAWDRRRTSSPACRCSHNRMSGRRASAPPFTPSFAHQEMPPRPSNKASRLMPRCLPMNGV
jgi:hypothetical protein